MTLAFSPAELHARSPVQRRTGSSQFFKINPAQGEKLSRKERGSLRHCGRITSARETHARASRTPFSVKPLMTRPSAPWVEASFSLAFYFLCICRGGLGLLSFRQGRRCVENLVCRPVAPSGLRRLAGGVSRGPAGVRVRGFFLLSPVRAVC